MSRIITIASDEVFQAINDHIAVAVPSDATSVSIDFSNDGITWADVEDYEEGQANIKCFPGQYFKVTFGGVDTINVLL